VSVIPRPDENPSKKSGPGREVDPPAGAGTLKPNGVFHTGRAKAFMEFSASPFVILRQPMQDAAVGYGEAGCQK
jgi:hypothetical protein